jgi:adenosylhomocysteine nucleosidase
LRILGIVAALKAEVRSLTSQPISAGGSIQLPEGTLLKIAGIGAKQAHAAAEFLIAQGATSLLSWGSAGALHPKLSPGNLILPKNVLVSQEDAVPTHDAWHNRLFSRLADHLDIYTESLVQSATVLASPAEKLDFSKQNKAIAVDMESRSAAEVAGREKLPFMAIRAIADPLDMTIPPSGLNAIDEFGRLRPLQLLAGLARNPAEFFLLRRLRRNFLAARATLATVAQLVGDNFLAP